MSGNSWSATAEIFSAECRLELEHESGRLEFELHYFHEEPIVVVRLDSVSAELGKGMHHYALWARDLPFLLEHAAQVLRGASTPWGLVSRSTR